MSFIIASLSLGFFLLLALFYALRQRSPLRAGLVLLGLLFLGVALGVGTPQPAPPPTPPVTIENFGEAAFKDFYLRYASFLGEPISPAGQYGGVLAQWFRFGRLEFKPPDSYPHPDFPKLSLPPLGWEILQTTDLPQGQDIEVPQIIQRYLASKARDDFYTSFTPLQPTFSTESPFLVQNFGEAPFKDFYDRYNSILGEPVSPAGTYKGLIVQWFQFARVEFHTEYDLSLHAQFPKFQLGLLGREHLEQSGLSPDPQPGIAPILERWIATRAPKQDILYIYGNPLTNPKVDKDGFTTQYFERAVFRWPTGSQNPDDVFRLSIGLELFNAVQTRGGSANTSQSRQAFLDYFYGVPLTGELQDQKAGMSTMFFTRAVFRWPTGSNDLRKVNEVPIGEELYARLHAPPEISPWSSPIKVVFFTLAGVALMLSALLTVLMRQAELVYGRV